MGFIYSLPQQVCCVLHNCFPELCGNMHTIMGVVEAFFVKTVCTSRALLGNVPSSMVYFQLRMRDVDRTVLTMK